MRIVKRHLRSRNRNMPLKYTIQSKLLKIQLARNENISRGWNGMESGIKPVLGLITQWWWCKSSENDRSATEKWIFWLSSWQSLPVSFFLRRVGIDCIVCYYRNMHGIRSHIWWRWNYYNPDRLSYNIGDFYSYLSNRMPPLAGPNIKKKEIGSERANHSVIQISLKISTHEK